MSYIPITITKAFTDNGTIIIPAGHSIQQINIVNTTANAITGGLKVGTTDGGVDVITSIAVGASALITVLDSVLLKKLFSITAPQLLYIQTLTSWNSANITVYITLNKLI